MSRRWILATSAMLATLAGCGVTELYIGFLQADGGTTTTTSSMVCAPGEARSCYDGPAGTEGVGLCRAGTQACAGDGASWGACAGEVLPAPVEDCASGQDQNCDGKVAPCEGVPWAKGFRSGSSGSNQASGVAVDSAGDVYITGSFTGGVDFGDGPLTSAGSLDVFVVKLDANGAYRWAKRFGDQGNQWSTAIAVDNAGHVLITGALAGTVDFGGGPLTSVGQSDVFVVKLDADGNHLWSRRFGDASDQIGLGVATDPGGNVILMGSIMGTADFGGGPLTSTGTNAVFVAKLDPNGNHVWSQRFGDAGAYDGEAVATDADGNVILAGAFTGAVDFGGGLLASAGDRDIFVTKLDPSGAYLWAKRYGDAADQRARFVATDAAGNVVITGMVTGQADFSGGLIPSGLLTSAGGQDIFVAKLDPSGAYLWAKRYGDAAEQQGAAVAVDASGTVLVVGQIDGAVDFGVGLLLTGAGSFVAAFGP
jgi:hypothetical protein